MGIALRLSGKLCMDPRSLLWLVTIGQSLLTEPIQDACSVCSLGQSIE